jgi:prevent-host-death family protein
MTVSINAVEARRSFGELLNRVLYGREEIIINRAGKPIAKLVAADYVPISENPKVDFRSAAGLGKDFWQTLHSEQYLQAEREEWS